MTHVRRPYVFLAIALVLVSWLALTSVAADAPQAKLGRITFEAAGADAENVLQLMAKLVKMSLVADSTVTGKLTISLKNVAFEEAMDIVCRSKGWAWSRTGDTILVVDATKFKDGPPGEGRMVAFPLKYADPVDVGAKLGLAISSDKVRVDSRTNTILIVGSEAELARAKAIVAAMDIAISQVTVVARIEEISTSAMRNLGVNWNIDGKPLTLDFRSGKLTVGLGYEAILSALEQSGDAKALAKPMITALDGKESSILLGDKVPMVTTSTGADGKTVETVTMMDVGVKLKIKPRINGADQVTLELTPEISTLTGFTTGTNLPMISTREAKTTVSLRNGETFAIGGLFERQKFENIGGMPFLSRIPIIGTLFSSKKIQTKETELIVLITPYILSPLSPVELRDLIAEPDAKVAVSLPRAPGSPPLPPTLTPAGGGAGAGGSTPPVGGAK